MHHILGLTGHLGATAPRDVSQCNCSAFEGGRKDTSTGRLEGDRISIRRNFDIYLILRDYISRSRSSGASSSGA